MSELIASKIKITDIDILKKAVKGFDGLTWNEGAKTFKSYSSSHSTDIGQCEHSITVKGAAFKYQIGVIKQDDGDYVLAYDEDDYVIREMVGRGSGMLIAAYDEVYVRDYAEKRGFMVEQGFDSEGNLQITMIDPN